MSSKGSGKGALDTVQLVHGSGASTAEVYLHGAHVTSFKVGAREIIFVSNESKFDGATAIRGGVPICCPQFGSRGPVKKSHGFVRNSAFHLASIESNNDGDAIAVLELETPANASEGWVVPLRIKYTVTLRKDKLELELEVTNAGSETAPLTGALHTYLAIGDITTTTAGGLKGKKYIDQLQDGAIVEETSDAVVFDKETDRIYLDTHGATVTSAAGGIVLASTGGFQDAVVWNPWVDKSKRMGDFGDEEFKTMLCIESARIGNPVDLEPGMTFSAGQTISPQ